MPSEIRRIDYTEIELRTALALYQAKTEGGAAVDGRVSGIRVMGGDEFNIVAKVSCPKTSEIAHKVFDHATTLAVMVLFSKQAGIPLPRKGQKILAPTKFGGVSMTVRYNHDVVSQGAQRMVMANVSAANGVAGAA